jgi:hypothetical protein
LAGNGEAESARIAQMIDGLCDALEVSRRRECTVLCREVEADRDRLLVEIAEAARAGWDQAVRVLRDVRGRTGSPAAGWAADYLAADPDRQAPQVTREGLGVPVPPGEPRSCVCGAVDRPDGGESVAARIAADIRRELVCCDVYDRDAGTDRAGREHPICFWGEAAGRIALDHGGDRG